MCKTEDERDGALKQYLGITLQEEERKGIRGMITELGRNKCYKIMEPLIWKIAEEALTHSRFINFSGPAPSS